MKSSGGDPHQLHLGTRIHCYRCSLPGLAGFAVYRREGTNADHPNEETYKISQRVYQTNLAVRGIMREDCFFDNNFYFKPLNN